MRNEEIPAIAPPVADLGAPVPPGDHPDLGSGRGAAEHHRLLNKAAPGGQRRRDQVDEARRAALNARDAIIVGADRQDRAAVTATLSTAKANQVRRAGRGRSIRRWVAAVTTAFAVGLLWVVDANLLVTLLLGRIATFLVTGVLVAASAVTAHLAGGLSREKHLAVFPAVELGRFKLQLLKFCLIAGPSLETGLGVLRAAGSGALVSSLLLALAGIAVWAGLALLAYGAHSPAEDEERRDIRTHNRQTKRLVKTIDRHNRSEVRYRSRRQRYEEHAQRTVDEIDIVTAQSARHDNVEAQETTDLPRTAKLRAVAQGELEELELAPFSVPKVRLIALCELAPAAPPRAEPLALPPSGGWK